MASPASQPQDILLTLASTWRELSHSVTWSSVAIYGSILGMTWLLYKGVMEPLLSPLRKIPGLPFNPLFGNMRDYLMKGQAMESTIQMIKKHGTVVRYYFAFGRERLMIADTNVMKHVLVTNAKNYIKPPSRMALMKAILGNGLVMSEGATHAAHKRLINPAFTSIAVKKMVPAFVRQVHNVTDYWQKQVTKLSEGVAEIDIATDLCRTTLDIIGEVGFGYDFRSFESEPNEGVNGAFQRILMGSALSWRLAIPFYAKLPFPEVTKFKSDLGIMRGVVNKIIAQKQALLDKGGDVSKIGDDVLSTMMLARDENGGGLLSQELSDHVMTLMAAGHETTSTAMSWGLLLMAQHPQIQKKLREEIHSYIPSDNDDNISWELLESMPYLGMVVKEILRFVPSVPLTLRMAVEDDKIQGENTPVYHIPKGTIMLLSQGPMMRRPELFEDPDTFWPERFEDSATDDKMYHYLPFLIGARMCLGYKFALAEMKVMLALFLYNLQFDLKPGIEYRRQLRTTMRPTPGPILRVSTYKSQ